MNQRAEIEKPNVDTEAIAARAEAATPGPWMGVIKPNGKGPGLIGRTEDRGTGKCIAVLNGTPGGKQRCADTYFIAHARQDIPTLLAALATAEQERDQARRYAIEYERAWEAAEAVIKAAQDVYRFGVANTGGSTTVQNKHFAALRDAVANYHKATGPQAENEEDDEGG